MPAKDLGSKHTCFKCSTKFYDMKKPVPVCPKCGADQRESPALKAPSPSERKSRAAAKAVTPLVDEADAAEGADADLDADEAVEDDEDEDDGEESDA
jgi:uncharacterized protein (TIGR02300 family)